MNTESIHIGKIPDINQLDKMDGVVNGIPFLLYIKDKDGKYIHANQTKLNYFGFQKEDEIIGLTDYDLCMSHDQAANLRQNDARIIKVEKHHTFFELANAINGETLQCFSYKSPFRLKTDKIAGMVGVSFVVPGIVQQKVVCNKYIPILSKRQNECLSLLSYGMTIKEIAKEMNLSPRTVEHYLEVIKIKLDCRTRSDLVKKYNDQN